MEIIIYIQNMWHLTIQGEVQGIWFWAALYTLIVCIFSLIHQFRTRSWPITQGELVEATVRKFGATAGATSNQEYVSEGLYQYDVSGITYGGTRISPWIFVASHNARFILEKQISSIQRYSNGKVKVFYNPGNPKKSFLIVAGKVGIFATLLIAVLPIILFFFKYHV